MKFVSRILLILLFPALLVACNKKPDPPLVFGSVLKPGYEPVYLARELGYFSTTNLHFSEFGHVAEVQQAFRNRSIQAAAVSLGEALQLSRELPDLKIALILDASQGADVILAQRDITELKQLQGHRIGMRNTVQGAYFLDLALKSIGMQYGQVEAVPLSENEEESAFRSHKVDALVTSSLLNESLSTAGAHPLFDSTRVPGKVIDVLVARDEDIGRYHNEMMEVVEGWNRALKYIHTEPDKAMEIMAKHEKMDTGHFIKAMQGVELLGVQRNSELLSGDQPMAAANIEAVQRFLLERGLISIGADTATLLDTSLLGKSRQ
jgi:NitT/TauT family transport system substrate-binding protein